MEKTIEDIEKEIAEKKQSQEEAYAKARADAEVREMANIVSDPAKALQVKLNEKVVGIVDTSEAVEKKIEATADKLVQKGLEIQEKEVDTQLKKAEKENNQAEFDLSEDDYRAFGQECTPRQKWKKTMIEWGNNFWFVILYVVCFFSVAPIYNYVKVIKSQSKVLKFVAIATGIVMLLACLGGLTFGCLKWTGVIQ